MRGSARLTMGSVAQHRPEKSQLSGTDSSRVESPRVDTTTVEASRREASRVEDSRLEASKPKVPPQAPAVQKPQLTPPAALKVEVRDKVFANRMLQYTGVDPWTPGSVCMVCEDLWIDFVDFLCKKTALEEQQAGNKPLKNYCNLFSHWFNLATAGVQSWPLRNLLLFIFIPVSLASLCCGKP